HRARFKLVRQRHRAKKQYDDLKAKGRVDRLSGLNVDGMSEAQRREMETAVRKITIRTLCQQQEVEHKMRHPQKLNPHLWYNEPGELNDGPRCYCKPEYQVGPSHCKYEGESAIPKCDPHSNNPNKLHHYRICVLPNTNYSAKQPSVIMYKNLKYEFEGFGLLSHYKLDDLPPCKFHRYNIFYKVHLVPEPLPPNFTVRSLDLLSDFVMYELLELLDETLYPSGADEATSCRCFHLYPRFSRRGHDGALELLPAWAILQHLLDNSGLLIEPDCLDSVLRMSKEEWRNFIDQWRGQLITYPGKKPSTIRVDQVDRCSAAASAASSDGRDKPTYPYVIHITQVPLKFGWQAENTYRRTLKSYFREQYMIVFNPRVGAEQREKLQHLREKMRVVEEAPDKRREVTVEMSAEGFRRTGLRPDVTQFALLLPHFLSFCRLHRSISALESRIGYVFKDKSLFHQAMTHPSSIRSTLGLNSDHVLNSMLNCGPRLLEYGEVREIRQATRKHGLAYTVNVMSMLPSILEKKSPIFGNDRLEYLGDAVVELIVTTHLFYILPEVSEGHLDAFRQSLVMNAHLALLARRLGLHCYLQYAHGMDFYLDSTFMHAYSDAFEAFMAAVYLDGGLALANRIFADVMWGSDPSCLRVWCTPPPHPIQLEYPDGDRHLLPQHPKLKKLTRLERRIGMEFQHIRLLAQSLSYTRRFNQLTLGNNQRLEHLGDTLLKFVTTDYLFKHFPYHHEGHLSILRNTMANKYTQGQVCRDLGLTEFIIEDTPAAPSALLSLDADSKIFADVLESFVGAVFVDKDLTWVERLCQVCFFPRLVEFILTQEWNDPKSKLQQCCLTLRDRDSKPELARYVLDSCTGGQQQSLLSNLGLFSQRSGKSVKVAQMNAAKNALQQNQDSFPVLQFHQQVIEQRYSPSLRASMLAKVYDNDAALVTAFTHVDGDTPLYQETDGGDLDDVGEASFDDEEEAADADKDSSVDGV
uniref:Ribonuclease n=1 Tax=Macrostomum lignano TaxID=282301 RepID=A0A1I8GXX7_9PLAT